MAIRTALVSVSDKSGLVPFVRALTQRGVRILSSGGTAKALEAEGIAVEAVESYTGSPEVMDGRVKTLHPRVHGGILSRGERDLRDLERLGAVAIDLVIVNLYPFQRVAEDPKSSQEHVVENIDIGGPSMVRSAAKNHGRVTIACDPADYPSVLAEVERDGDTTGATRARLAAKAFAHTAAYDASISGYLSSLQPDGARAAFPGYLTLPFERAYGLRYGENPHQAGAFYVERDAARGSLARAESLGTGGKELSFNNLVDTDAALDAVRELDGPAAVIVKHTNPCGAATRQTLAQAYLDAREADPVSAFGGIVALNREVDATTARALAETFLECVVAPSFSAAALDLLRAKKNLRLLATGTGLAADHKEVTYKRVGGGLVVQDRDTTAAGEVLRGSVVTQRAPTPDEIRDLEFAWRVAKYVKSNAIVLAHGEVTVGIGAGQMSRVVSVQIACEKAGAKARPSVLASDAFFPFPDGIEAAAKAGVAAVAQPGGSVKDPDVIAAADALGLAMVFTESATFATDGSPLSWPDAAGCGYWRVTMAAMNESCSVCGKGFDVQFRYQMEERDGGFAFFCSHECHRKVVSGEATGGATCAACQKRFYVELVSQVVRVRGELRHACSDECRKQVLAEADGARLGSLARSQGVAPRAIATIEPTESAPVTAGPAAVTPPPPPASGPIRLAIFNHKGGTGKTTTSVSIAAGFAQRGLRVLLVDTDSQGNVGVSLGVKAEKTLYHVLVMGLRAGDAAVRVRPNLDLIVSNETLAAAELFLAGKQNRDCVLRERLASAFDDYDVVLLDCSPSLSLMNQNALVVADGIVVPVACDFLSLVGVRQVIKTVKNVNQLLHHPVQIEGVLPTFYDARARICRDAVDAMKGHFGDRVLPPIRQATRLKEAPAQGKTIFEYAPESNAAEDYAKVVGLLMQRTGARSEAATMAKAVGV